MSPVARKAEVSLFTPIFDVCLALTIIALSPGTLQYLQQADRLPQSAVCADVSLEDIERLQTRRQELSRRYEQMLSQFRQKSSFGQPPQIDPKRLQAAQDELHKAIEAMREEIARLQKLLANAQHDDADGAKRRQELSRLLEELQRKIAEAEKSLQDLRYSQEQLEKIKKLQQETEALHRKLQEVQQQQKDLNEEIARLIRELQKIAIVIKVHPKVVYPKGMKPYGVIVHQGALTPIKPPYYEGFRIPDGKIFIRFVQLGPSASDAFQPGSEFLQWIDSIDAKTDYVVFLVAPDSLETFRTAREELRKRKIACGWEPHEEGNGNVLIDPNAAPSGDLPPIQ